MLFKLSTHMDVAYAGFAGAKTSKPCYSQVSLAIIFIKKDIKENNNDVLENN